MILTGIFFGLALGGGTHPAAWSLAALILWALALHRPPAAAKVPAGRLWAAWIAWVLLCAALSAEPPRAFSAASRHATALLVFALASANFDAEEREAWLPALLGAAVVAGAAALFLSVRRHPGTGILGTYYNYTAALAAAAAAAGAGALATGYGRGRLGVRSAVAAASLAALGIVFWERSRGSLAAVAAAAAVILWRSGRKRILFAAAAGALAFGFWDPAGVVGPLLKRGHHGAFARPLIWKAAASVAADHPFFGEGPGCFDRGFLRHNFPAPEGAWLLRYGLTTAHAHSEPLQSAAETGWPGLALLLAALAASLAPVFLRPPEEDSASEGALLASTALLTQGLFDNIFALPGLAWVAASAFGVASVRSVSADSPDERRVPSWALGAGLALTATAWWPGWFAAHERGLAFAAPGAAGTAHLRRALSVEPASADLWADLARLLLRGRPPDAMGALEALSRAEALDPFDALHPVMSAEILAGSRRWELVLRLADRALELENRAPQARLLRTRALFELRRPDEASAEYQRFLKWEAAEKPDRLPSDMLLLKYDPARRKEVESLLSRKSD